MTPAKSIVISRGIELVRRSGRHTQLFTSSDPFSFLFISRMYVSLYGAGLAYHIIDENVCSNLRRATDKSHMVQVEVFASWVIGDTKYEKLLRDFPIDQRGPLAESIRLAAQYLHRSGPVGKRTPKGFRDEDRNWRLYTDKDGVKRLRLSYEYQLTPRLP